jgi:hypothetical protein
MRLWERGGAREDEKDPDEGQWRHVLRCSLGCIQRHAKLMVHHWLEVEARLDSWLDHISEGGYIIFIRYEESF